MEVVEGGQCFACGEQTMTDVSYEDKPMEIVAKIESSKLPARVSQHGTKRV